MEEKLLFEIRIIGGYKDEADMNVCLRRGYENEVAESIVKMAKESPEFRTALDDAMFGAKTGK